MNACRALAIAMLTMPAACAWAESDSRLALTPSEQHAVEVSLQILRGCCLPDGAMTMTAVGTGPDAPVWIPPYFSAHNAMALLASGMPSDCDAAGRWLEWMALHQEPEGWWNDWSGTRSDYKNTGRCDAHDSVASMYLLVLRTYQAAGGKVSLQMQTAAERALACLDACVDPATGLTWAKPTYRVAFLMDNCESYAGYASGATFFDAVGDPTRAGLCARRQATLRTELPKYLNGDAGLFEWARHPDGAVDGGLKALYPHGLANVFGCSFVANRPAAFSQVTAKFSPDTTRHGTGPERFAMAAARVGGEVAATWRTRATTAAAGFTASNVYSFRPALYVLLACAGADWMPCVASASSLGDAELDRITAECAQRGDMLFRKQAGKPLARASIQTDWNGRGDFTREYNQSILLFATRAFHIGEQVAEANAALREMCDYHLARPQTLLEIHSFQQVPRELVRLQRLYGPAGTRTKGLLSDETDQVILKTLWAWASEKSMVADAEMEESQTWTTHSSENHHANLFGSCWAAALALAQSPEYRDRAFADGRTAAEHAAAWTAYLREYYLQRGKKGMTAEIDSPSYASATLAAAYVVYDLTDDPLLAHRASAYITLWWALWAQQQIDGVSGGAKARCYPDAAQRGGDFLNSAAWYVMGMGRPEFEHFSMIPFVTSAWRMPDVVRDLALDVAGRGCYEIRERRPGLMRPGSEQAREYAALRPDYGGIVRYGYCTPDFIMGSLLCEARPASDWANLSSQNRWHGVVFRGARDARIYPYCESPKSTYNSHWAVQRKGTLIGQKLETSKHTGALRVWFSKDGLSAPVHRGGWFFAEAEGAWAAVRVVSGAAEFQPDVPAGMPVKKLQDGGGAILECSDAFSPVILEVARKADFPSFAAFQDAVLALPLEHEAGRLAYTGLSGSRFTFFTDQTLPPEIDGQVVDYAPAKVYDSPFVQSEWNSGVVTIQKGPRSLVLDFNGLPPTVGERWMPADVDWQHPVYETSFDDARALDDWRLEGGKRMVIEGGTLVLESEPPAGEPKAADNHLVCWLHKETPADFLLEFTVRPENRARGLNIVFFNARSLHGESIFDPTLRPRTGMFPQYHSGDLNNYHISYWAADRGTANIRKNKGFHLVAEGKDLVGAAPPDAFQTVRVYKRGGTIRLTVDDRLSAAWDDDGTTYGPVWSHSGWIGLRQIAHTGRCAYGHVKVWPLVAK